MENLVKRLRNEAGLTEEQAVDSIRIVKDFMDKEGMSVDWNKYLKGKFSDFKGESKNFITDVSGKMDNFSNKVADKASDVSLQTKRKIRDYSKKIYDELNDELGREEEGLA